MNQFPTFAIRLAAALTLRQREAVAGQECISLRMNLVAPPGAGAG